MTFDEAIKKARTDLIYDDNVWAVWTDLLLDLKEEYAPTVEMTEEYAKDLDSMIKEVREDFALSEIPDSVKPTDKMIVILGYHLLFKYLVAILHPETIKIIDK